MGRWGWEGGRRNGWIAASSLALSKIDSSQQPAAAATAAGDSTPRGPKLGPLVRAPFGINWILHATPGVGGDYKYLSNLVHGPSIWGPALCKQLPTVTRISAGDVLTFSCAAYSTLRASCRIDALLMLKVCFEHRKVAKTASRTFKFQPLSCRPSHVQTFPGALDAENRDPWLSLLPLSCLNAV